MVAHRPARVAPVELLVVDHPLVAHKLTLLRESGTGSPTFRRLTEELVTLLAYEATRSMATEEVEVATPVAARARGTALAGPRPVVVPILRAGLGMLEGMQRLLPTAEVGFLGIVRDEETLSASTYANRLPASLAGREVFVLDPMLATGGTLAAAVEHLVALGAARVTAICLLAAPEGLAALEAAVEGGPAADLHLVVAAVDERLDARGYITPGLGDAGDRLYGAV